MAHSVWRSMIVPALGFGAGGLLAAWSGDSLFLGFLLSGMLGGASLGWLCGISPLRLALLGGLGFFIGFQLPLFIVLTLWEPAWQYPFIGLIGGGLGGGLLGWGLNGRKRAIGLLALGGAAGFGVGMLPFEFWRDPLILVAAHLAGGAGVGFSTFYVKLR